MTNALRRLVTIVKRDVVLRRASEDIYMSSQIPALPPPPPPPAERAFTTTDADALVEPPGPLHESSKVAFALSGPVCSEPLMFLLPVQPFAAVQVVAFVAVQFSVVRSPAVIVPGVAVSVTVGAGGAFASFNPYVP